MTGDIMRAAKNIDHIDFAGNVGQAGDRLFRRESPSLPDSKPAPE